MHLRKFADTQNVDTHVSFDRAYESIEAYTNCRALRHFSETEVKTHEAFKAGCAAFDHYQDETPPGVWNTERKALYLAGYRYQQAREKAVRHAVVIGDSR